MPQEGRLPHTSHCCHLECSPTSGSGRRRPTRIDRSGYRQRGIRAIGRSPAVTVLTAINERRTRGVDAGASGSPVRRHHRPTVNAVPTLELLGVDALRDTLSTFRDVVHAHAARINRLNVYPVPDGDTGTNMARTLDAVVAEMDKAPAELAATCGAISYGALMGARGNSGVILSQILRGVASTLKVAEAATGGVVASALEAATTGAYAAVLTPVEGTILTVVRESAEAARVAADSGAFLGDVLRAARDGGARALDQTPELLPVLKDAGVVDAGGAGFLLLLDAALHVVDDEPLPETEAEGARPGRRGCLRRGRPPSIGRRRRAGRQRAALRGDVPVQPRRRRHRRVEGGMGAHRRLDRRRRRRRRLELSRPHQRHRRGDRDRPRPRRSSVQDPRHRSVRGGCRRARQPRVRAGGFDGRGGRAGARRALP